MSDNKSNHKTIYICVTPFFPSLGNWRGAYVLDQVKAIQRNSDYEVVVMKPTSVRDKTKSYEVDGVKVYLFPTLQTPSYMFNGFFNSFNGRSFVKALKALGIDLSRVQFVHTHTGPFAVYGLALRKVVPHIKVFVQHHDLDPFTIRNGKWAHWRPNAVYRAKNSIRLFNEVDLHICISKPVKDNLLAFPKARKEEIYAPYLNALKPVAELPSISPKSTYILYNGVDVGLFKPLCGSNGSNGSREGSSGSRSSLNGSSCSNGLNQATTIEQFERHDSALNCPSGIEQRSKIFRIGCIANFQELKDHITLIKAFEILINKGYTNMRLSLLGSGETTQSCIDYLNSEPLEPSEAIEPLEPAKPLNLSDFVEWPSEVTHDHLPDYYRSLDLFVLPSYFEGFGCVYTEAYACGVPFMGVYDQGAAECISPDERHKWVIQPHDYEQLAKLIESYYLNPQTQKLCQSYDIDELIKGFMKYLQ